jgi:hypothetical protein
MNHDDPGDDVREHRLQQAKRGDSNWIVSLVIGVVGTALAVALVLWITP